jgi:hypothetical protein
MAARGHSSNPRQVPVYEWRGRRYRGGGMRSAIEVRAAVTPKSLRSIRSGRRRSSAGEYLELRAMA